MAHFNQSERSQNSNNLTRFENRNVSHPLRDSDVLNTDKLGLKFRLAIFEKHGNDLLKVVIKFVECFTLRMRARKSGDKPDKKSGLRAAFDDSRISSHARLQSSGQGIINLSQADSNRKALCST